LVSEFVTINIYDYNNIKIFAFSLYELIIDENIEDIKINETETEIKTFGNFL